MFKFFRKIINKIKKQNYFAIQCVDGKEHSWTREFQFVGPKRVSAHNSCRFCELNRHIQRVHGAKTAVVTYLRFGELLVDARMNYEDIINGKLPSEETP